MDATVPKHRIFVTASRRPQTSSCAAFLCPILSTIHHHSKPLSSIKSPVSKTPCGSPLPGQLYGRKSTIELRLHFHRNYSPPRFVHFYRRSLSYPLLEPEHALLPSVHSHLVLAMSSLHHNQPVYLLCEPTLCPQGSDLSAMATGKAQGKV